MAGLKGKLSSLGWTPFSLDSLSDEGDSELAGWLESLGYDATDLPELRRLIREGGLGQRTTSAPSLALLRPP